MTSESEDGAAAAPWRRRVKRMLHALVWLAMLVTLVHVVQELPSREQWARIAAPDTLLATALLWSAMTLAMLLRTLRWRLLLGDHDASSLRHLLAVIGWSSALMTFTPARAGDFARAVWLRNRGGSGLHGAGVVLAERLTDLLVLLLLSGWALHASTQLPAALVAYGLPLCGGVLLAYIVACMALRPLAAGLARHAGATAGSVRPATLQRRVADGLRRLVDGLNCLATPAVNVQCVALTAAVWVCLIAGYHAFLGAVFPQLGLATTILTLSVVNLTAVLGLLPGNLGLYELSAVYVLAAAGIDPTAGFAATLVLHAAILLFVMCFGLAARHALRRGALARWEII